MRFFPAALTVGALALAACGETPDPASAPAETPPPAPDAADPAMRVMDGTTYAYTCSDGSRATLTFAEDGARVTLSLPVGEPLTLSRSESASGFRYEAGTIVVAGAQDEILITQGDTMIPCRGDGAP